MVTLLDVIHRRLRTWTIPVVSSSVIHAGIVLATLWLAVHWSAPSVIFLPLQLLEREQEPPPPVATPPPAPRPRPVAAPTPPPPPRESPPRPEPEIARPVPPPEPAKTPDPPAPAVEAPKPPPVAMAPSPQVEAPPAEARPVEPRPVEITRDPAASNGEPSAVAMAPAPATHEGPAAARAPARAAGPDVAAAPPQTPGSPGPLVIARPGEVSRPARPSGGYQVIPPYPATARQQRIEGTTLLKVLVLADGRVGSVAVQKSAGHADLDQAAADAVRKWQFDPARKGSEPVAMWVLLPVQFQLKDQ